MTEIVQSLHESRVKAHQALDDYIAGIRNAPHITLEREQNRARAFMGLLECMEYKQSSDCDPLLLSTSLVYYNQLLEKYPEEK